MKPFIPREWIRMRKQPKMVNLLWQIEAKRGKPFKMPNGTPVCSVLRTNDITFLCEVLLLNAPYSPGEVCWVRETWKPESPINGTYKGFLGIGYKDGTFELTGWPASFEAYPNGKWRSPVTMPQWASRRHVRILSCVPEQRGEWGWKVEWEENNAL